MSRPLPPWRALVGSSVALGAVAGSQVGIAVMAPEFRVDLGISLGQAGMLISSIEFALAVTVLAWGFAADRIGEKVCLLTGLLGGGVAIAVASRSSTFLGLICGLLVMGVFAGAVSTAGPRIVLGAFSGGRQVFALSIRQSAIPLMGLIAASAVAPIAISRGTNTGLLVLGLAMLVAGAIVAAAILPGAIRVRPELRQSLPPATPKKRPSGSNPLSDSRVWRISAASAILLTSELALITFAGLFLVERQGLSTVQAGFAVSMMLGIGVAMLLIVGAVADYRRQRLALLRVVIAVMFTAYLALAILSGEKSSLAVVAMVIGGGLAQAWMPLLTATLGRLTPREWHGAALGVQQTVMAFPAAASPLLFGLVVERVSWQAAFLSLAVLVVVPMLLIRGIEEIPVPAAEAT